MNLEPQTYILFSLTIDAILVTMLLFIWIRQRQEWHALFWAVGQAALSFNILANTFAPVMSGHVIATLTLTTSLLGFWAGTEYFLGALKRRHAKWCVLGFALANLGLYALWHDHTPWIAPGTALLLGLVILWSGIRLVSLRTHYRFLGWVLILRGVYNLSNSFGFVPPSFEGWLIFSATTKTLSMLCLIHAVQEKILQRYAHTIDSLSSGFLIQDRDGMVHVANERCVSLLGYRRADELVGRHIADIFPSMTRQMVAGYFERFERTGEVYPLLEATTLRLYNGKMLPVELISSPYFEDGQLYCMMQLIDISERTKKDEMLYRAARYDNVTGFFNRHGLVQELTRTIDQARDAGMACAVLFIDLDKFKRINDSFGHDVGDQLLCQMAQRLRGLLRPADILARFGGDEFIIVLPALDTSAAVALARACGERIIASLSHGFSPGRHAMTVSASIGIACYPAHGGEADTLIRNADIAMYSVKTSGRGELRVFDEAMSAYAREALVIDGALRGAIEGGELHLLYQPIVDASRRQMKKVEALLRWNNATLGPVSPDRFIPVAEDSGLIVELGSWVLNEACSQLGRWRETLGEVGISINVSARQLVDPAFIGLVEHALSSNGLAPHQLELELTERVLIDDGANVRTILGRLVALGVRISLDDFGTGYSSLSYLTQFQIDTLKIDRSFVMDIEHSRRSHSLVAAIIAMGHSLGLELVAEGVETAGQAAMLEKLGCHYLQGYHFSKPVAADEITSARDLSIELA